MTSAINGSTVANAQLSPHGEPPEEEGIDEGEPGASGEPSALPGIYQFPDGHIESSAPSLAMLSMWNAAKRAEDAQEAAFNRGPIFPLQGNPMPVGSYPAAGRLNMDIPLRRMHNDHGMQLFNRLHTERVENRRARPARASNGCCNQLLDLLFVPFRLLARLFYAFIDWVRTI